MFLDESGVNTMMTRLHGRYPVARRLLAAAPWILEGAMDGEAFKTYTARSSR